MKPLIAMKGNGAGDSRSCQTFLMKNSCSSEPRRDLRPCETALGGTGLQYTTLTYRYRLHSKDPEGLSSFWCLNLRRDRSDYWTS